MVTNIVLSLQMEAGNEGILFVLTICQARPSVKYTVRSFKILFTKIHVEVEGIWSNVSGRIGHSEKADFSCTWLFNMEIFLFFTFIGLNATLGFVFHWQGLLSVLSYTPHVVCNDYKDLPHQWKSSWPFLVVCCGAESEYVTTTARVLTIDCMPLVACCSIVHEPHCEKRPPLFTVCVVDSVVCFSELS